MVELFNMADSALCAHTSGLMADNKAVAQFHKERFKELVDKINSLSLGKEYFKHVERGRAINN